MSDVLQQVAETACLNCAGMGYFQPSPAEGRYAVPRDCFNCDGTKLQWRQMSYFKSQCASHGSYPNRSYTDRCVCSDRVADVTLEKVLPILRQNAVVTFKERGARLDSPEMGIICQRFNSTDIPVPYKFGLGHTDLEAACVLLLATIEGENND